MLANMARLQKDMDDAKRSVTGAMSSIESSVAAAKGALIGLGVLGIAASFANSVKGSIDLADNLNKLSQRTGVSTENLSQLQYAAKLADVSTDSLTTGIKKLNVSIAAGLAGDKEKAYTFKMLGINLTDASGATKKADQVLLELADTFAKSKDGAGKTAAAVELLGKAGDEMIPLLNGGGQAIKDLMKQADKLGLTIGSDFAKQAEEFNDNLTRVQVAGQKTAILFAGDFVQGVGKAMKAMADATVEGGKLAGILAGLQTLLTGDDRHKANVEIVKGTELVMAAQDALDKARARGDEKQIARLTKVLEMRRAEVAVHVNMAAELQAQDDQAAAAAKKMEDARAQGAELRNRRLAEEKAAAEALAAKTKELADAMSYYRKRSYEEGQAINNRNEALDRQKKILKELAAKQYLDYVTAIDKQVMASVEALGAGMREAEQYGLLKSAITALTVAKLEAARVSAITPEELAAIDAQIANYTKLIEVQRGMEAAEASRKAADDAAREWQKATDQISQSLTDALMTGGKSGAQYLVDLFRTIELRPNLIAAVNPVAGAVNTTLGGANGLTAISGGFGSGVGAGFRSLFNESGISGAFSAGSTALGAGNIAGGLGTFAGALGPIAIGAMLANSLFSGGGGPKTEGGADLAAGLTSQYAALAGKLGLKGNTRFGAFSSVDSAGDALTQLQVSAFSNDRNVYSREARLGGMENVGRSAEELAAAAAEEVSRAMLAAVTADDTLAPALRAIIGSTDAYSSSLEAVNTALSRVTTAADLQERLYQLTATDADKLARTREREREAMDASLQPLLNQIYAQEDLAVATAAAAQAAQDAAAKERAVAQERASLQTQLWSLQGNTAAIRQAELAALDPANRALQEQVWALQDTQAAIAAASASSYSYATTLNSAAEATDNFAESVKAYLTGLGLKSAGGGQLSLAAATTAYRQQLALAGNGDATARSSITSFSDAYLAAINATSGDTLAGARATAGVRADLSRIAGLPSFDVGTPYVPADMLAMVHRGEAIMPAATAERWRDGTESSAAVAVLERIHAQLATLTRRVDEIERRTNRWDTTGLAIRNVEGETLEVTT